MRIRRFLIVLGILLIPTTALADDHRADLFGGGSYARGSSLGGFHTTLMVPFEPGAEAGWLLDLGIHHGKHDDGDLTRTTFMTGVRLQFPLGQASQDKYSVFAVHALAGNVHDDVNQGGANAVNGDRTDLAFALGASVDYLLAPHSDGGRFGIRVQADYVFHLGDSDDFPRVSAGLLYRWGRR